MKNKILIGVLVSFLALCLVAVTAFSTYFVLSRNNPPVAQNPGNNNPPQEGNRGDNDGDRDDNDKDQDDVDAPILGEFKTKKGVNLTLLGPDLSKPVDCQTLISGKITGSWFFETSFPVTVVDATGKKLIEAHAEAQSDWMTSSDVIFTVDLKCEDNCDKAAKIIFSKDNPSGLAENDDSLELPISFNVNCKK